MRYSDLENCIKEIAASSSETARHHFAHDTIRRLHQSAVEAISKELTDSERRLLTELLAGLDSQPAEGLKAKLNDLTDSMCRDPVRAIEFHADITELLCAIDSWIDYRRTADAEHIFGIAIAMVNSVDYAIGGDTADYSVKNMLGASEMREEFERQQHLLMGD